MWSVAALVLIVLFVAAHAGIRCLDDVAHRILVTSIAVEPRMPAVQLKSCSSVVIEVPDFPVPGIMAGFAPCPEPSFVGILLLVATDAIHGHLFKGDGGVAFLAVDLDVLAEKRKAGQSVVEPRLFP